MSNLITLTPENYYSQEANMQYVSVSQYKDFNGTNLIRNHYYICASFGAVNNINVGI